MQLSMWWIFVLLLVVICDGRINETDYSCGRTLPSPGRWVSSPPYFFPKYCPPTRIFEVNDTATCLKGRTVYGMGNSIARQFVFNMLELVGGASVTREGQVNLCPKLQTNWDASCYEEFNDVSFRFLFFRHMDGFFYHNRSGFPFINGQSPHNTTYPDRPSDPNDVPYRPSHIVADNCVGRHTGECLKSFFINATSDDILIFSLGFAFCQQKSPFIDYEAWLRSSAAAVRGYIMKYFPGTVFHVTNAPVHYFRNFPKIDACLRTMDKHLWELWNPSSFDEEDRWYSIDQWSINEGRPELYNDGLHYIGPLSMATCYQILNLLCPGMGKTFSPPPLRHLNTVVYVQPDPSASNQNQSMFLVNQYGYYEPIPFNCDHVLPHNGTLHLTQREFDDMHIQWYMEPFPDLCRDHTLLRPGDSRTVFVVLDGSLHSFSSGNAFRNRGYDFENVHTVTWVLINRFKQGPAL